MRFSVLASGSSGNSVYIETDEAKLLVDAGLSAKQLEIRLSTIERQASDLDAIFITHEHIDHVRGLSVLSKRFKIPVYINEATWSNLPKTAGNLPQDSCVFLSDNQSISLRNMNIDSVLTSHDAAKPNGFIVEANAQKIAIFTDIGYISQKIIAQIRGADSIIFESNHDVGMLLMGSYPWNLKRRILGDTGHLSNQDAGNALSEIITGSGEQIYLAHLSNENNIKELAYLTVENILTEAGFSSGRDYHLFHTYQDRPTQIKKVKINTSEVIACPL